MRVEPDTIVGKKIKTNKKEKKTGCADVHTNGEKRGAEKRRRGRQKVEVKRRVQNRGKGGCE